MKIMGIVQDKICQLLKEIKGICEAEGIRYYLGGWTALSAWCQGSCNEDMLLGHVMIHAEDADRMIDAIEERKPANRSLDHLKKNPEFPGFFLRYTAEDTTAFERYHYKGFLHQGISVHICFLASVLEDSKQNSRYELLEEGLLSRFGDDRFKTDREKKAAEYALTCLKEQSPMNVFDDWIKAHSVSSENVFCRTKLKPRFSFEGERKIFDKTRECLLNGILFSVPEDMEEFFKHLYQRHYKVVFDEGIQYPDMMISTVVPYKEFFNSIDKDAHTLILENEKVREIQRDGIAEYGPPKRYLDRVWTQVNAEQKRLSLQKIYDDVCLERIREVYARGDYEETYRILKPWQEMNQYCKDNKLNREDFIVNPKLDQLVEELGLGFGLPS